MWWLLSICAVCFLIEAYLFYASNIIRELYSKMNKTILITGSCGFIFSNFIRKIVYESNRNREKYPFKVISLDRVSGNSNLLFVNKNHIFHVADIRDQHIIDVIFQHDRPDIVIHGASETFVDYSLTDPNSFISSNVFTTQFAINACVKHRVEKLIYISTDEV